MLKGHWKCDSCLQLSHHFRSVWASSWWNTCRIWKCWLCRTARNRNGNKINLDKMGPGLCWWKMHTMWPEHMFEVWFPCTPGFIYQRLKIGSAWLNMASRHIYLAGKSVECSFQYSKLPCSPCFLAVIVTPPSPHRHLTFALPTWLMCVTWLSLEWHKPATTLRIIFLNCHMWIRPVSQDCGENSMQQCGWHAQHGVNSSWTQLVSLSSFSCFPSSLAPFVIRLFLPLSFMMLCFVFYLFGEL